MFCQPQNASTLLPPRACQQGFRNARVRWTPVPLALQLVEPEISLAVRQFRPAPGTKGDEYAGSSAIVNNEAILVKLGTIADKTIRAPIRIVGVAIARIGQLTPHPLAARVLALVYEGDDPFSCAHAPTSFLYENLILTGPVRESNPR